MLVYAMVCAGSARAQLDLLTLREAESLVELIPDVVSAQKKGECPDLSPMYEERAQQSFQVRRECGPEAGTLIFHYTVNRRDGNVTLWGDNPVAVADDRGKAPASQLVQDAQSERNLPPVVRNG